MDDFEEYFQDRLKKDKKLAYIHNNLLSMGYVPGEFPSELIYKLGDEFEKQDKNKKPLETINTSSMVTDELIQLLKNVPTTSFIEFEKENKKVKKLKNNVWEVDGKEFTTPDLLKFLNINYNPQKIKEDIDMQNQDEYKVKCQLEDLQPNELLIYNTADQFGFNKLLVYRNKYNPDMFVIWNENDEGDCANLIKYSSLENTLYWIMNSATSYDPQLLKNKYIKMEESWDYGYPSTNYIDVYIWKDDSQDSMEFHEFMAGLKDFIRDEFSDYNLIRLEVSPWAEKKNYYTIVPIFDEVNIGNIGDIPAYELLDKSFKKDFGFEEFSNIDIYDYKKNLQELKDELKDINSNMKKFKTWGFKKVKDADNFSLVESYGYVYKNKRGEDVVDLEYNDLHVEFDYGPRDWETGTGTEYFDEDIDYTYTVDKQSIDEFLVDLDEIYNEYPEFAKAIDADDYDKYYGFIDEHFDELLDKYYGKILEHFRDDAEREASENIDPEDYIYQPDYDD